MNLLSNSVVVYPSAKRANQEGSNYRSARLVGEKSIVDIITHTLDFDSFVLSDEFVYGNNFEFILKGYYFSIILTSEDITQQSRSLYAYIDIDTTDADFPELIGADVGGNYTGLNLDTTMPDNIQDGRYYIHLLDWDANKGTSGAWVIPKESKYKFYLKNIYMSSIDIIDCGTVPASYS